MALSRVKYNGRPSAILRPIDAADRSIQPLVGHLCRSIVYAAVVLHYWSFTVCYYCYYYCRIIPFIINAMQSLLKPLFRRNIDSMRMRKVKHCTSWLPQLSIVGYS